MTTMPTEIPTWLRCEPCDGNGWIMGDAGADTINAPNCPDCNGTGRQRPQWHSEIAYRVFLGRDGKSDLYLIDDRLHLPTIFVSVQGNGSGQYATCRIDRLDTASWATEALRRARVLGLVEPDPAEKLAQAEARIVQLKWEVASLTERLKISDESVKDQQTATDSANDERCEARQCAQLAEAEITRLTDGLLEIRHAICGEASMETIDDIAARALGDRT